jgi:hypothetical protein
MLIDTLILYDPQMAWDVAVLEKRLELPMKRRHKKKPALIAG